MHPSPRAFSIAAAGFGLALLPSLLSPSLWPMWIVGWGALLLALALDAVFAPRARGLSVSVSAPEQVGVGGAVPIGVRLSGATRGMTDAWVALELRGIIVSPAPVKLPRPSQQLELELPTHRRGKVELLRVWLRYSGPLGLMRRTVPLEKSVRVLVVPNVDGVRSQALGFFHSREQRLGMRVERYQGDGSEFDMLQEFTAGMDNRSIDWKASARHGALLSRKHRIERNREIVLAIDTGRLMAEPLAGLPRLDHALHAALLLAYFTARAGDRVRLFRFGEKPLGVSAACSGRAGFQALAAMLSDVEYSDGETNFTWGLTDLCTRLTRRCLVIVLTDFTDSISAELLQENVQRVADRHLVVFVTFRDVALSELAERDPTTLADLNRAITADELERERMSVLGTLRRRGIFCLDAPPQEVGVQLVNRYLEIKRRELM
jgi:uncharacterized protein (DUF58 family)